MLCLLQFLHLFLLIAGRTDSNGGHNSSTGYHYHHGYPAHQHTNGLCPYENTSNINSGSISSNTNYHVINNDSQLLAELQEKYQSLEDENYDLKDKLDEYEYSLEEYGYNSIEEMGKEINSLNGKINNMYSAIFLIGLIVLCITYNIGVRHGKKKD